MVRDGRACQKPRAEVQVSSHDVGSRIVKAPAGNQPAPKDFNTENCSRGLLIAEKCGCDSVVVGILGREKETGGDDEHGRDKVPRWVDRGRHLHDRSRSDRLCYLLADQAVHGFHRLLRQARRQPALRGGHHVESETLAPTRSTRVGAGKLLIL